MHPVHDILSGVRDGQGPTLKELARLALPSENRREVDDAIRQLEDGSGDPSDLFQQIHRNLPAECKPDSYLEDGGGMDPRRLAENLPSC